MKSRTEDLIITGDKVKKVVTEEQEFDVIELIAEKEKELEDWIESVRLYNEAAEEIEKDLKKDIKKLKKL